MAAQHELSQTRTAYQQLCARLPWSAEPHSGWNDTSPAVTPGRSVPST
ncbi:MULTISPECIES: hypothetical protein [Streptomyces]|nr:hypothetical protein [Streptomyces sp. A1-5]UJB39479.1 hypothetical protein HRD51_05650 [Streptomyces sp. A1-5]